LQASLPSLLRELTCHMGLHSVTCHATEVTFPPLPQPKLVLDLATPEGCKAELTQAAACKLSCSRTASAGVTKGGVRGGKRPGWHHPGR